MDTEFIKKSIENSENSISKLDNEILKISGWSSNKVRHLLNNLCSLENINYLEIGLLLGSTFISALYKNNFKSAIGIDLQIHKEFYDNRNKFLSEYENIKIIENNCFSLDLNFIENKIDIFLYDGDHSEIDQERAFSYYDKILNNKFIAIVDDWNDIPSQIGTKKAFEKLNYKVIYERELFSDGNCDINKWWNGIYVGLIEKDIL